MVCIGRFPVHAFLPQSKCLQNTGGRKICTSSQALVLLCAFRGRLYAKWGAAFANGISELEEIFAVKVLRGLKVDRR
jgi:hypothetical protein